MDCKAAQERLEAVRVGSPDLQEPAFEEAAAHLEECTRCAATFEQRQQIDERIGEAVRKVEVPGGAKAALLEKLASADVSPAEPGPDRRVSRRVMWTVSSVAAALMVAGVAAWSLWPEPPRRFSITELRESVPLSTAELPAFDETFEAHLPRMFRLADSRVETIGGLRGVSLSDEEGPHVGAVLEFELPGRQRVRGAVLIVPASRLAKVPKAESIDYSPVVYTSRGTSHYASAAWQEGELVYVCFVRGSDRDLRLLKNAIQGPAA